MSFILDALRKSETDRQRQAGPGLIEAGYRPPARRRAVWLPVLVVVLVANLVVMAFLWQRRAAPPPAAPASTPEPQAVAPPIEAPAVAAPAPAPAPVAAAPAPADAAYADTADLPAVESAPVTETLPPPSASTATAPPEPLAGATRHISEDLPSAQQLMAAGAIPVQDLHLDIHVWSAVPGERFAFINMRKYGEGAQLPLGVRVEEITRDGVVLSQNGQRFILNRD